MLKRLIARLIGTTTSDQSIDQAPALRAYRTFIETKADEGSSGDCAVTEDEGRAAVVVAEIMKRAKSQIIIFGEALPHNILLAPGVIAGMHAFQARNSEGRITVIASNDSYQSKLDGSDLDMRRITFYTITDELAMRFYFRCVLADTQEGKPSYWHWPKTMKNVCGQYEFRSPVRGPELLARFASVVAKFGSPK